MRCPDEMTLAAVLDGEDTKKRKILREHLDRCERCRARAGVHDDLGEMLRSYYRTVNTPQLREGMECPSPEEIAAYVEGGMPVYRRRAMLRHVCVCPRCARLVLHVSNATHGDPERVPPQLLKEARARYHSRGERGEIGREKGI